MVLGGHLFLFHSASEIFTLDCHNPCEEAAASQFSLGLHIFFSRFLLSIKNFLLRFPFKSPPFSFKIKFYLNEKVFVSLLSAFGISLINLVMISIPLPASFLSFSSIGFTLNIHLFFRLEFHSWYF